MIVKLPLILLIFLISIEICFSHVMQVLKNLKIMTNDVGSLRGALTDIHSSKGYLQVTYFNDKSTCRTVNSIYYYQLATCLKSGDPNAVGQFVKLSVVLKENNYLIQWSYFQDSSCTSMIGYPNQGKVAKQICSLGSSIEIVAKIPTSPPSPQMVQNSMLLLLYSEADVCQTKSPMYAIQAVFTINNQCMYSYYGDKSYSFCNSVTFTGKVYHSIDGTCSHGFSSFTHNEIDPCQSDHVNIDATYAGHYNFVCFQ